MPAGAARRAGSSSCAHEAELGEAAKSLLGKRLVTHQTGPEGRDVKRVYVEAACDIAREIYLALSVDPRERADADADRRRRGRDGDRGAGGPLARRKIIKIAIDPAAGLSPFHGRQACLRAGPQPGTGGGDGRFCRRPAPRLYRARRGARRDQPAGHHRRGQPARARRQDGVRRQRAVPPPADRGATRRG